MNILKESALQLLSDTLGMEPKRLCFSRGSELGKSQGLCPRMSDSTLRQEDGGAAQTEDQVLCVDRWMKTEPKKGVNRFMSSWCTESLPVT